MADARRSSRPQAQIVLTKNKGFGCRALSLGLYHVQWSAKFRPSLTKKYDVFVNLVEFLQIYTTAIQADKGEDNMMANYFPIILKAQALS
uniref:Uncharacterized protein n=1 Tax=Oryza meridionalis TaxID=40149 RepID=A0A0E0DBP1_9ORYZ